MPDNKLSGEFILSKNSKNEKIVVAENKADEIEADPRSFHPHNKPHFYSAFSYYPEGIKFQNQEKDEEVILLVRQHFITNLPWVLGIFFLSLLPPLLFILSPLITGFISVSVALIFFSILFYYLILFSFALLYFTIWYFNVGIVTNKRLIDIDVHNILVHVLSEARLNSIQDVTVTQIGGIRSIFNYGDVDVQTEAIKQTIEFQRIPKPNFVRTIIGNLVVHKR